METLQLSTMVFSLRTCQTVLLTRSPRFNSSILIQHLSGKTATARSKLHHSNKYLYTINTRTVLKSKYSIPYLVPRWKFPLLRPNTDQSFRFNRSRDTSGSQWFRLVTKKQQNKIYKFACNEQKRPRTARLRENPMREPISKIFSKTISAK